ncbi:MAG TPA: TlpA disulfide reductase family protein [Gemmatimonadaceae bacterium]|nr:TlpA disulfide reductase family protein [Gemmatimonadaceae bacterium]
MIRGVRARAACVALLLVACSDGASEARVEIGSPVPAYAAVSLGGDSVSLASQRGKVILLNVWATWCHPCRDEIPELQAIHERYAARGLELVGVSVDTESADDAIRAFMRDFKMSYPVWRDPSERISAQFHIVGVPATFLIDREGVLRWRKTGPIQPGDATLSAAIEQALGS